MTYPTLIIILLFIAIWQFLRAILWKARCFDDAFKQILKDEMLRRKIEHEHSNN